MATLPYHVLHKLRCDQCGKFLSCGPVTTDSSKTYCGRCKGTAQFLYGYDRVAKNIIFPCCFWLYHCTTGKPFNDIRKHEQNCSHRSGCIRFCSNPFSTCRSTRRMDATKSNVMKQRVPDVIQQSLGKCSVCEGTLSSSPIYANKDNIVCHRCSENIGDKYVRENALETLLTAFEFPCINKEWGCPIYQMYGKDTEIHEQQCSYKPSPRRRNIEPRIDADGKMRGLILSHRGPQWGTIMPNRPSYTQENEPPFIMQDGLLVPTKKISRQEQDSFRRYREQPVHRNRQESFSRPQNRQESFSKRPINDGVHRTPSYLKSMPDIHQYTHPHPQYSGSNLTRQDSNSSAGDSKLSSNYNEMNGNQDYPAVLDASRLRHVDAPKNKPGKAIIRAGRYYDTNYNKVLKEFNWRQNQTKHEQEPDDNN